MAHPAPPQPSKKKFRVQKSNGKVLALIFWDQDGILLIDYFPKGKVSTRSITHLCWCYWRLLSRSRMRPGTCFVGWHEGPLSNFLPSSLPSEISNLLVSILTSGKRKSLQGPNLESRVAGEQQWSHALSQNLQIRNYAWAEALSRCSIQVLFVHASGLFLRTASLKCFRTFR